jgi:hypothetical protein
LSHAARRRAPPRPPRPCAPTLRAHRPRPPPSRAAAVAARTCFLHSRPPPHPFGGACAHAASRARRGPARGARRAARIPRALAPSRPPRVVPTTMPFAVIALALSAVSLLGFALAGERGASLRSLDPASLETAAVGVVVVIALVIMLVPGALVRILYGRRPTLPAQAGALTAEERAMTRFDREEGRLGGGEP